MGKSIDATKALLEEMHSNNYHWSSDRATPQRGGGKYSVDAVTLLASRMDALAQRLEKVTSFPSPAGSSGSVVDVYTICETCGVQGPHLPSVTMAHLPLNTSMPIRITSLHHSIFPTSLPTTKGERLTPTPHIQPPSQLLKITCAHQASNPEHLIHLLHHLHLHLNHLQPTWRT